MNDLKIEQALKREKNGCADYFASLAKNSLRAFLDIRGYRQVALKFPPPPFCTDNAAMIAWAGIEMFQAGWESGLGCKALRKWSIDANAVDGGILGATDWKRTSRILT